MYIFNKGRFKDLMQDQDSGTFKKVMHSQQTALPGKEDEEYSIGDQQ